MKRLIIGCCLLVLMASCGGGQKKVDPFAALTEQIDSMKVLPDSIQDTTVVEEQIPASADESFADFFYNFASDAKFQRSRVVFPFSLYFRRMRWTFRNRNIQPGKRNIKCCKQLF